MLEAYHGGASGGRIKHYTQFTEWIVECFMETGNAQVVIINDAKPNTVDRWRWTADLTKN